jgi:hypothetical protein
VGEMYANQRHMVVGSEKCSREEAGVCQMFVSDELILYAQNFVLSLVCTIQCTSDLRVDG